MLPVLIGIAARAATVAPRLGQAAGWVGARLGIGGASEVTAVGTRVATEGAKRGIFSRFGNLFNRNSAASSVMDVATKAGAEIGQKAGLLGRVGSGLAKASSALAGGAAAAWAFLATTFGLMGAVALVVGAAIVAVLVLRSLLSGGKRDPENDSKMPAPLPNAFPVQSVVIPAQQQTAGSWAQRVDSAFHQQGASWTNKVSNQQAISENAIY